MLTLKNVKFAHLHVHNQYSVLDGYMSQAAHIQKAKDLGLYAIAETNHGKMYGSYSFYKNCTATKDKKEQPLTPIKPIIGVEAYVAPNLDYLHDARNKKKYFHMVLLAKNYEGYKELCRSTRRSEPQSFKGKPILTDNDLKEFLSNGNIIALSACLGGEIQQHILNGNDKKAVEKILFYKDLFKGEFYMELQNHGIEKQIKIIPKQLNIAKECDINCVITSDSHFANKQDKKLHDILMCMQFGIKLNDYKNTAYTENHYLKSKEELFEDFKGIIPNDEILKALNNTSLIADKCDMSFPKENHYPKYEDLCTKDRKDKTADEILKERSVEGLNTNVIGYNIFSASKKKQYKERLETELNVIKTTGYSDYFLIVSDVLRYYDSIGGYSGLGRGSCVGSLVSYAIGITKVDPIEYGLYFDRFLNTERVSPPDADLDFDNLRYKVFDYTTNKYSKEKVCKIITFGTMASKGAIRAIGRVLNTPLWFVDKIAKTIPGAPGITIKKALDANDDNFSVEFKKIYEEDDEAKKIIDLAEKFEGVISHTGVHAAACIIGDKELSNYIPLQLDKEQGWISQYYKDYNEQLGLLKLDYLGLNNLTVIKETARIININHGLSLNHQKIIELALKNSEEIIKEIYAKGNTKMVFQFESKGMRDTLISFNPKTVSDLILLNAVYRPGPLQYIEKIIENKNNPDGINYDHECLRPILEETYGYPVYQEQIMAIFRSVCGYSLGKADLIRRAMGKKKDDILDNAKKDFVFGYLTLGLSKQRAEEFFEEIRVFAKYSFNKSHAAAYTITSLETGYLKYKYPQEYMTACLSYSPKAEAYPSILEECKKMSLSILLPSINKSQELFTPEDNNSIRFGLSAIKGVGKGTQDIIDNRPYDSFSQFIAKFHCFKEINKSKIENLAYAGAFDELNVNRSTVINNISKMINYKKNKKKVEENQMDFFSSEIINDDLITINELKEFNYQEKLEKENEVLFAYVSGHPLDQYRVFCEHFSEKKIEDLSLQDDNSEFIIIARIKEFSIIYRKKDNAAMGKFVLEDLTGQIDSIAFTKVFSDYKDKFINGSVLKFKVKAQIEEEYINDEIFAKKQFIIKEASNLDPLNKIFIRVDSKEDVDIINNKFKEKIGGTQILFYLQKEKKLIKSNHLINIDDDGKEFLEQYKFVI